MIKRLLILAMLLAPTALLAGCGGDDKKDTGKSEVHNPGTPSKTGPGGSGPISPPPPPPPPVIKK